MEFRVAGLLTDKGKDAMALIKQVETDAVAMVRLSEMCARYEAGDVAVLYEAAQICLTRADEGVGHKQLSTQVMVPSWLLEALIP